MNVTCLASGSGSPGDRAVQQSTDRSIRYAIMKTHPVAVDGHDNLAFRATHADARFGQGSIGCDNCPSPTSWPKE
jgi:hypothetical protein